MSQKTRQRLRFAVGASPFATEKDLITSGTAKSYRGTDVQLEISIWDGSTFIDDLTNYTAIYCTVVGNGDLSGDPLMQLEVLKANFKTLSAVDWNTAAEEKHQVLFEITKDELQLDFSNSSNGERTLRLVFHGVTDDDIPRYVTLGWATWTVLEDGAQNGLDVVGAADRTVRVSTAGTMQILNPETTKWHDMVPTLTDGYLQQLIDQDPSANQ